MSKHWWSWPVWLGIVVMLVGGGVRLASLHFVYHHPDEVIAVKISEKIAREGALDTDWENADLPRELKYPQYNFSGYLLFAAGVVKLAQALPLIGDLSVIGMLRGLSCLLGIFVVALTFLLGRQLAGVLAGIGAAFFVAVNPLLYQDSLYARPETFVTALTLIFLYLLGASWIGQRTRLLAGSLVLGILVGTKISMLALIPVAFLALDDRAPAGRFADDVARYGRACIQAFRSAWAIVAVGLAVGFCCAAPYAVVNFEGYLFGLAHLNHQYTTGHWPHGLPDGSFGDRLAYAATYFFATAGSLWFWLALCGGWCLLHERRFRLLAIFLGFLVVAIRFGSYPTFFERNFSHLLPLFLIVAAHALFRMVSSLRVMSVVRAGLALLCVALVSAPALSTLRTLVFSELAGRRAQQVAGLRGELERKYGVAATRIAWVENYPGMKKRIETLCGPSLIEYLYPEDKYSIIGVRRLEKDDGFVEVGRVVSPFARVPPSTLHTYFSPTTIFLFRSADTPACKAGRAVGT